MFTVRNRLVVRMRNKEKVALAVLFASFLGSRLVYFLLFDVSFDCSPMRNFLQIIDPELLKTRLLESVFYLHGQPPLFNLALGTVVQLFPENYGLVFRGLYLAGGLAFTLVLYRLMVRMQVRRAVAVTVSALFSAAPATVLFENWLFYTYPLAFLLCLSAWLLHRYLAGRSFAWGTAFFCLLAVLLLSRGIFSPLWLLICFVAVFAGAKPLRRKTCLAAVAPFLVVALFLLKQWVVFGELGAGNVYLGPNLSTRLQRAMSEEERTAIANDPGVSPLFFTAPFKRLRRYRPWLEMRPPVGIPVLDQAVKSTGVKNVHHVGYLAVSRQILSDAWRVMRRFPEIYLRSFAQVVMDRNGVFAPAGLNTFASAWNRTLGESAFHRGINLLFYGNFPFPNLGWFLVVGIPGLFGFGWIVFLRGARRRPADLPFVLTLFFVLFNILWVMAGTAAISFGDFNRYRFKIDALFLLLLGLAVECAWRRLDARRPGRRLDGEPEPPS